MPTITIIMKKRYIITLALISFVSHLLGQKITREQYISQYYQMAIDEMNLFKIPASITLAQGILETESGNSDLARIAKNHFGIKCKSSWTGMKFIKDDDTKNECFRAYATAQESYRDHSLFLAKGDRYATLFTYDIKDYKSWAYGLKSAGYATNPNYPQMLIKSIEDLKLYEFDNYGRTNVKPKTVDTPPVAVIVPKIDTVKQYKERLEKNVEPKYVANNLRLVVLESNMSLIDIANKENVSYRNLLIYNELENEQPMVIGQNIFLEKKLNGNGMGVHEVKPNESMYDIAQKYGVTTESLRKNNKLERWEQPAAGESIFLNKVRDNYIKTRTYWDVQREKEKKSTSDGTTKEITRQQSAAQEALKSAKGTQPIPNTNLFIVFHTVKSQETIFRISKIYDVAVQDILIWNNTSIEAGLSTGQVLKIITAKP